MIKSELKALYYKQKYKEMSKLYYNSKIEKEKEYINEINRLKNDIRMLNIHIDYLEKENKKLQS